MAKGRSLAARSGWLALAAGLVVPWAAASAQTSQPPAGQPQSLTDLSLEELLEVKIVSASQQTESIQEAPVPVTVITREMIRAIGARNLQDALVVYVPGMTLVTDHNEVNVAMRGIYGSSQQKILVMLDGHRLNSRAYSMANPDYSIRIDLDRVRQIEVLRGPGSSLYGNIALTAVINIVTESGGAIDGLVVTAAGGGFASSLDSPDRGYGLLAAGTSFGATYGKAFSGGHDLVLWGGWFRAEGQEIPIARAQDYSATPQEGFAHVGAFRQSPSHDLGIRYRAGALTIFANRRYGKQVEPFTSSGPTGEVYNPGDFRPIQGEGPGLGSRSNHVEIKYSPSVSPRLSFDLIGYYDTNEVAGHLISSGRGRSSSFINWLDDAVGGVVQANHKYTTPGGQEGTLLVGGQIDRMRLTDSSLPVQRDGEWTGFGDSRLTPLLELGSETIYSVFTQVRHRFNQRWIVNNGIRFDVKDRHRGVNVSDVSPRFALVYLPSERFDVKLSYARSFVDAPYWYRYNIFPSYQGSQDLRPEHLDSLQVTPSVSLLNGRLRNTFNVFLNHVKDFVFRNNNPDPGDPRYTNAGALNDFGVESETIWIGDPIRVRGIFTYQRAIESHNFDASGGEIFNIPRVQGNVVVDARPVPQRWTNTWVNLTLSYAASQLSPIAPTFRLNPTGEVVPYANPDNRVGARLLANVGVRVSRVFGGRASFDATVFNLFDTKYAQGGSVRHPYPQAGRSIVVGVTTRFRPAQP